MGDQEQCPLNGMLNYNTILQPDFHCRKLGKASEVLYIQAFVALSQN
ncbi:hypothetical protein DBR06_SOUSAS2510129, partial [Sousa chinensis]